MKKQHAFLHFSQLIPKVQSERIDWVGIHKCELFVMENIDMVLDQEKISLKKRSTLTECWLYATPTTTMLQMTVDQRQYSAIDIEYDDVLQDKLKFKLVETD